MDLEQALIHIAELEELLERKNNYISCNCNQKRKNPSPGSNHQMFCKNYIGELTHTMKFLGLNPTFGGWDYDCSCGAYLRVYDNEEVICPRSDQTQR